MIRSFMKDEEGAVTVDWTVMTAAIVGLGLASAAAVSTGAVNLGNDVESSLSGASVSGLRWAFARELVSQNFADGNFAGWSRGIATTFGAWGPMLGPFGNETFSNPLTYDVRLPEGMSNARISFDLVIGDSWDGVAAPDNPWTNALGDSLRFIVDGQVIAGEHFVFRDNHPGYQDGMFAERRATAQIGESTFNVVLTPRDAPIANVGGSGWNDQRWSVQIEAVNAPQDFQLGFSSTANQSGPDESFGIQNFNIAGN
jgi:Flp pilus assembly pilin Flp